MGKRLKQQRRGKGTPRYRAPSHRAKCKVAFRVYDDEEKAGVLRGEVIDFIDDPFHNALVMKVKYDNGNYADLLAPEGIALHDMIEVGVLGRLSLGGIYPLFKLPDGAYIYNIEKEPGDGGKLVRSPCSYATIISKEEGKVYVKLPSRHIIALSPECRAQLGVVAGGGWKDKPLVKAGNAFYKNKARNRLWPKVRGVHMSAYNHPHGGKQHHEGKPTTVSRHAPPGAKVGHIAARSTGRRKTRKTTQEVR